MQHIDHCMLALQRKHIVDLDELLGPTSPPGLLNTEELVSQHSHAAMSNLSCSQITIILGKECVILANLPVVILIPKTSKM